MLYLHIKMIVVLLFSIKILEFEGPNHVFRLVYNICPGFWVHISLG